MDLGVGDRIKLQGGIASLLARGTSSTVLGLDGIGSDVFLDGTLEIAKNDFNVQYVHVNCSELVERTPVYFYRSLLHQLVQFLDDKDVEMGKLDQLSVSLAEVDLFILVNVIQEAISLALENTNGDSIAIVITNLTKLNNLDTSFYSGLRSLRNKDKDRLSFLFRDTYKFIHSFTYENTGELFELIRSNLVWIPLPVGKVFIKNIVDNEKKFDCEVSEKLRKEIYDLTKGHAGLVKYCVSYFSVCGEIKNENLLANDAIRIRLERIVNELDPSEKDLIHRVSEGEKISVSSMNEKFIVDSHLLYEDDGRLKITIPLLKEYLTQENNPKRKVRTSKESKAKDNHESVIVVEGDNVYVAGKLLDTELTRKEFSTLSLLFENRGEIVSRDDVASAIWGDLQEDKFSDWAIDQTVSRLRKKIGENGYNPKLIKTIRGRGFKLVT